MKKRIIPAFVLSLVLSATAYGHVTAPIKQIGPENFRPIDIDMSNLSTLEPELDIIFDNIADFPTFKRPKVELRPVKPKFEAKLGGNSLKGLSSWYCKAGISICHYKYGPNTYSAAAGPKLRAAIGKNWRNKVVNVTSNGKTVQVKLVDWCQCYKGEPNEKIIDLYWIAFSKLPNNEVTVSW